MKSVNRRQFISLTVLTAGNFLISSCHTKTGEEVKKKQDSSGEMVIDRNINRKSLNKLLEQRVNSYMAISHNCAQSSFLALKDQFNLEAGPITRALTPLPGLADRGQTCGAITGCLMAIGLVYGNDNISDWEKNRKSLQPAGKFCDQFKEKYGTFLCSEIHKIKFGKSYQLIDPEELAEFQAADGTRLCSEVVSDAVKMAAGVILEPIR